MLENLFFQLFSCLWKVHVKSCSQDTVVLKKKKPNCLIKVCLAYLLSKMACAWTMFWLLSLSIIMLNSCAGLIEVLHHRSEGIFFFSNWSDAFILGIMHRQQYITFFSTYLFFIFYFIIFIILLSLCGIGAPHRKCHELFMYKTDFALSSSPFAKKKMKRIAIPIIKSHHRCCFLSCSITLPLM